MALNESVKQRVRGRLKGLLALTLALVMAGAIMPVTPALAEGSDQYWLVNLSTEHPDKGALFFGQESIADATVYSSLTREANPANKYVAFSDGQLVAATNSPLSLQKRYGAFASGYEFDVAEETYFNLGVSEGPEDSSGFEYTYTLKCGDRSETCEGYGDNNKASLSLQKGKYRLTAAVTGENDNINGTYTLTRLPAVTVDPQANDLTYTGSAQELVTAGKADPGDMYYALGTEAEPTGSFTTTVPTGTEVGTYYVWYRAADEAGNVTEPKSVAATIKSKPVTYEATEGSGSTYVKNSMKYVAFVFTRSASGETKDVTFHHFLSVSVDGNILTRDKQYTAESGSVKITLAPEYLNELEVGEHTLTATFDDGSSDATFTVENAKDYPVPTMSNSKGGGFANKTDEITYTIDQKIPTWATSVKTWVDLEDVLQYTVDKDGVTVTCDGKAVEGAVVDIDGQKLTVTVADATALRDKTIQITYKAKLRSGASLDKYLNSAKTTASVPYQAHTIFDNEEDHAVVSKKESVKFKVGSSSSGTKSTTTSKSTLAKTGDPTSLATVATMALAGLSSLAAGIRKRR